MTFEIDFPELETKFKDWGDEYSGPVFVYHQEDIQEHCLSKQRVREAIGRVSNWHIPVSMNATVEQAKKAKKVIEDLMKELGLEE